MGDTLFEPTVLKWAREKSIGPTLQALTTQLEKHARSITPEMVGQWESGTEKPSFNEVKKLAEIYRRPVAVFFLATPPSELSNPPDKRTFDSKERKGISPQGLVVLRKARRAQRISKNLTEDLGETAYFKYRNYSTKESASKLAEKIRKDFDIPTSEQFGAKRYADFFEIVRSKIEATGVITLTTGAYDKLPKSDARAFSLTDNLPYLILVNSSDTEGAKNFSLLHEFGHVLLRDGGICNDFKSFNGTSSVETFCNNFAASFLVPEDDFLSHELLIGRTSVDSSEVNSLASEIARDFKVSRFVILRRLLTFELIDVAIYKRFADVWSDEIPPKKKGGGTFSVKSYITKNGRRYSSQVVEAYRKKKITRTRVSDYLGFKTKHLGTFEKLFK